MEVASALSSLTGMRALAPEMAVQHLADFDVWRSAFTIDVALQLADFRLASLFIRRFDLGLRATDALHAAICRGGGHRWVTLDARLAAAAETLGLAVERPA